MAILRSTAIAKTDICDFSTLVQDLSDTELSVLLNQHKDFITSAIKKHEGRIVKGEGDSFWIIFPSVTAASLAALDIQHGLQIFTTNKADDIKLSFRIVITLGDVLHQDGDIFGDTINLTALIESVTPSEEIYLSHAAWLAVNKAEIQATFVNDFHLKGIEEPVKLFRVEQKPKTFTHKNQIIVFLEFGSFSKYYESTSMNNTEDLIMYFNQLIKKYCDEYNGMIRLIKNTTFFLTFTKAAQALSAISLLNKQWNLFLQKNNLKCELRTGIHKGDVCISHSRFHGEDIMNTIMLEESSSNLVKNKISVLITGKIKSEVEGSEWEQKLTKIENDNIQFQPSESFQKLIDEIGIYELYIDLSPQQENGLQQNMVVTEL